jgi:hypothetical protein
MDVSWSEAQRSLGANVIARCVDRATTEDMDINRTSDDPRKSSPSPSGR